MFLETEEEICRRFFSGMTVRKDRERDLAARTPPWNKSTPEVYRAGLAPTLGANCPSKCSALIFGLVCSRPPRVLRWPRSSRKPSTHRTSRNLFGILPPPSARVASFVSNYQPVPHKCNVHADETSMTPFPEFSLPFLEFLTVIFIARAWCWGRWYLLIVVFDNLSIKPSLLIKFQSRICPCYRRLRRFNN